MHKRMMALSLFVVFALLLLSMGVSLAQSDFAPVTSTSTSMSASSPVEPVLEVKEAPSSTSIPYALMVVCVVALIVGSLANTYLAHQSSKSAARNVPLEDAMSLLDKGIEFASRVIAPRVYASPEKWDDAALAFALSLRGYSLKKREDGVLEIVKPVNAPPSGQG